MARKPKQQPDADEAGVDKAPKFRSGDKVKTEDGKVKTYHDLGIVSIDN